MDQDTHAEPTARRLPAVDALDLLDQLSVSERTELVLQRERGRELLEALRDIADPSPQLLDLIGELETTLAAHP
jgi:hypothetical protein